MTKKKIYVFVIREKKEISGEVSNLLESLIEQDSRLLFHTLFIQEEAPLYQGNGKIHLTVSLSQDIVNEQYMTTL